MRNNPRIWIAVAAAAVLALLMGGWFLGAQPMLASAASADDATANLVAQNQGLQSKLVGLAKSAAKTDQLTAEAVVLNKSVPSSLKPNTFVRRVNEVAAQDDVTVQAVTPGSAVAYTPPASVQAALAASAASAAAAAAPAPAATTTPTPAATPAVAAAPAAQAPVHTLGTTNPLITGANFTVVPMIVTVKGTPDATLQFVKDIQRDERLFLVSGYSTSAGDDNSAAVTAVLTGSIYTLTN